MSWKDREFERQDEQIYPYIYWVNVGSSLDPRREAGGFAMKLEQAKILGAQISPVIAKHHHDNAYSEVHFADRLELAVMATRFTWLTKDDQPLSNYQPGAHGKVHALCLVRDINGKAVGPVIFTASGTTSKAFGQAWQTHKAQVQGATAGKAPAYAFFGLYGAAGTGMVGSDQQSRVTKLAYSKYDLDPDTAYIGDEALSNMPDWDTIDKWVAVWDTDGDTLTEIPMITGPQRTFLGQLLVERGMSENDLDCPAEAMTQAMASEAINKVKAMPPVNFPNPQDGQDIVGGKDFMDEMEALGGVDRNEVVGPNKWGWVYQTALDKAGWDRGKTVAELKQAYGTVTGLTVGQVLDALAPQPEPAPKSNPVLDTEPGLDFGPESPEPDLGDWGEEIPF